MSVQKAERSPSFRSRHILVKVKHETNQLPQDFFPKTMSNSPKKRGDNSTTKNILVEWYERQESKQRKQKHLIRKPYHRPNASKSKLTQDCTQIEKASKQRYVEEYYELMKNNLNKQLNLILKPTFHEHRKLMSNKDNSESKQEPKKIRIIKSQNKRKRGQTQEQAKVKQITRMSLKQLPRSVQKQQQHNGQGIVIGFDGMLTFNRYR